MLESVAPESVGLSSKRLQRVTHWLQQEVAEDRIPGGSVLIGRHGNIAYLETTGYADKELGKPFNQDTVLRIFSMTKAVTTVAAMMLYEKGCFQLDHPVANYLPEFKNTPVWLGDDSAIDDCVPQESPMLVKHLMTHTSGLTYGFMQANVVDAQYREDDVAGTSTLAEMVERLAEIPLICQPGTQWNYSVSTDVLGRLVEVWSGQTLEDFFIDHLFRPLGMEDTGFYVVDENHKRFAALYAPIVGPELGQVLKKTVPDEDAPERGGTKLLESSTTSTYLQPTTHFSGGGGLVSTINDYARFCQMLLNGGKLDGVGILSPKTVAYMRANHLPENRDMAGMGQPLWSETSYDGIGFGLGFAVVLDPVKANIITSAGEYHWGGAASTFFWIDPEEDLFVIFLTQLLPSSTHPLRRELRALVYQALTE